MSLLDRIRRAFRRPTVLTVDPTDAWPELDVSGGHRYRATSNPPPTFRYPGAAITGGDDAHGYANVQPTRLASSAPSPIGRRIVFEEAPEVTRYWIANEIRMYGKASWRPVQGMTGTVVDVPRAGEIGTGLKIRWDVNGEETWLGALSRFSFVD